MDYVIRQVRFPVKVYNNIAKKAATLGLPVSTYIRLSADLVAGGAAAKEKLKQLELLVSAVGTTDGADSPQ
jgi:hypothetical protein